MENKLDIISNYYFRGHINILTFIRQTGFCKHVGNTMKTSSRGPYFLTHF